MIGEPAPLEREKKFLIKKPSEALLAGYGATVSHIGQVYLTVPPGEENNLERRVRARGTDTDGYRYTYTEKFPVKGSHGMERVERERIIGEREYKTLLAEADETLNAVNKTRYCFVSGGFNFELDVYPGDDTYAILEVEFTEKSDVDNIVIPAGIDLIRDVTDDTNFKNRKIAERSRPGCAVLEI